MQLITLHSQDFFDRQKIAGKCVSECLNQLSEMILDYGTQQKKLNLLDLENVAVEIIAKHHCTPTFYQYKGFPGKICLSVNNELVHGIPHDYDLQNGDVVKFDLGATFEGAIADAARTEIYGFPKENSSELRTLCQFALAHGIAAAKVGNRIGAIGEAISKFIKNSKYKCSIITKYGGHSIGLKDEFDQVGIPHAPPFIANVSKRTEGVRIQPGMTLAIEPLICAGNSDHTKTMSDQWTVVCQDLSFHFENTVQIHENKIEIIT